MANSVEESLPFIEGRGKDFCRGCLGLKLFSALDLGDLPIANELLIDQSDRIQKFPLHLKICSDCGLGQVADVVTPERIFKDYRYLSSMSSTFLKHASDFVAERIKEGMFSPGNWVLEIASNDGYLLKNFLATGITAIGVEPAENVAEISRQLGIETISDFFSSQLAIRLLSDYGYPKLIIANNVMAHVPDLFDFVKGLAILSGPETQISIENPSLANILLGMQFDTIYHEHYSYLSASAVSKIGKMNGLSLFKVEELSIHGGSNRYWLRSMHGSRLVDPSVDAMTRFEVRSQLFEPKKWEDYASRVSQILAEFSEWLHSSSNVRRIYGYGAAAKASTILNSVGLESNVVLGIADASSEKQHRFMPPDGIKVISPSELFAAAPTDIVIFPWNIKPEIASYLRLNLDDGVRLWCVIPFMHEVSP